MNRVATAVLVVSSLLGGGSTVYSAFQIQVPSRTALKVTTDPANVWSWHREIMLGSGGGTLRERVLVDFDGNGRMDTEDPDLRVTVTDMQCALQNISFGNFQLPQTLTVWISDGVHKRWILFTKETLDVTLTQGTYQHHLTTPLVLPVGSELFVEARWNQGGSIPIIVNLVGRAIHV